MSTRLAMFTLALAQASSAAAAQITAPPPEEISPGMHLLRGAMLPERGPDGNSVLLEAPDGLIVVDTGRHAWHSDAILALAKELDRPIVLIVNTHWHLDHSSGNGRIKAVHPQAMLYTTRAVDRALAEGGFLVRNLDSTRPMLDDPNLSAAHKDEVRIFIATMDDERDSLRPDVPITESGEMALVGRTFDVRVSDHAVSDADLWLFDTASGVAIIGDLVTLPAPFFETACPAQWRAALDEVWAMPFSTVIPGHGEPMSRAQFDRYRSAFGQFMDCVEGETEASQCASGWLEGVAALLGEDERARRMALEYAGYYTDMLRQNDGRSAECLASGSE